MKKHLICLMAVLLTLSIVGCGLQQINFDVSIVDSRGNEISLKTTPQKIVSLIPSDTEILFALGLGDKITAVSEYCNYPEEAQNKQKLSTGEKLNVESIIALKPDVVFLGQMSAMDDQVKQLEDAGVKVVITEANNLEDTYRVIEMVGAATGKSIEAQNIIKDMKKGFDDIKAKIRGLESLKVYIEVSPLQYGLWSCGQGTFVQELIDIMGAVNIFADIEGWSAVSEEQVIERNPDVIFTTASLLTGVEDPAGDILGRSNWGSIGAIKEKKVFMLDADMLSRPGPRLVEAAGQMIEAIYGEIRN